MGNRVNVAITQDSSMHDSVETTPNPCPPNSVDSEKLDSTQELNSTTTDSNSSPSSVNNSSIGTKSSF